jgi:hypothetical protein
MSSRLFCYWYYRSRLLEGTRWLQQAVDQRRRPLSRELLTGLQDRLPSEAYEQAWRTGRAEALHDLRSP